VAIPRLRFVLSGSAMTTWREEAPRRDLGERVVARAEEEEARQVRAVARMATSNSHRARDIFYNTVALENAESVLLICSKQKMFTALLSTKY